jgi:hypothetical protein
LIETHGEDIREHLFRYLLSDISKLDLKDNTPHFQLLKENAHFSTNSNKSKTQAMVSFGSALEQFSKSDVATKIDLADLFDLLEFDPIDKTIFSLPLVFSGNIGVKPEICSKGIRR